MSDGTKHLPDVDIDIPAIRTYEDDLAHIAKDQNESALSMSVQEQERKERREAAERLKQLEEKRQETIQQQTAEQQKAQKAEQQQAAEKDRQAEEERRKKLREQEKKRDAEEADRQAEIRKAERRAEQAEKQAERERQAEERRAKRDAEERRQAERKQQEEAEAEERRQREQEQQQREAEERRARERAEQARREQEAREEAEAQEERTVPLRTAERYTAPGVPQGVAEQPAQETAPQEVPEPAPRVSEAPQQYQPRRVSRTTYEAPMQNTGGSRSTGVLVGIALLLVLLGGSVFAFMLFRPDTAPITERQLIDTILITDETVHLPIEEASRSSLMALLETEQASPQPEGFVTHVFISEGDEDAQASPRLFLELIGAEAPASLVRSLQGEMMLGLISIGGERVPFWIVETESYEQSAGGLLRWEGAMQGDLSGIASFASPEPLQPFTDAIIENRDVRVVSAQGGGDALLYTFLDQETILVTEHREAFTRILPLFISSQQVR